MSPGRIIKKFTDLYLVTFLVLISFVFVCESIKFGDSIVSTPILSLRELNGKFDKSSITVSGIGVGGAFAQIVHLSFSRLFTGIGLISSPFYKCGGVSKTIAEWGAQCGPDYTIGPYQVEKSVVEVNKLSKAGLLDPLINLKYQNIFVYGATESVFADFNLSFDAINIYEPLLAFPTQTCTRVWVGDVIKTNSKFSKVRRDYEMFTCLIGKKIKYPPNGVYKVQKLRRFNQKIFFEGDENIHNFENYGFVYIPPACQSRNKKCLLHIDFHSCKNAHPEAQVGNGDNLQNVISRPFADVNNIIYVFPQIKPAADRGGYDGCFDSFGYTGEDYGSKDGIQIRIIRNMLQALLGTVIN